MSWFNTDLPYLQIMRTARKRRMFHPTNPNLNQHCRALKNEGLLAGSSDDGYRLTKKGHQCLKGKF